MRYYCTVLQFPPIQETFIHFLHPPLSLYFKAQRSIQVTFPSVHPSFLVFLSPRYLMKIRSWCVHISGHKVHCSGPRCSLLVLVRTCMVTSWRLVLMEQTSLSCILLQLPPCPLWTQMSCSVITATLLSLSSVMSVLLFATSCLDPGQVSAVSRASCMKEHYILYYRKLKTFSCLSSLDFGVVINAVI